MANLSIEKLATVIGSEPEMLLSQIKEAGLSHSKVSDEVTDADKKILKTRIFKIIVLIVLIILKLFNNLFCSFVRNRSK